jgi:hypothetical protein
MTPRHFTVEGIERPFLMPRYAAAFKGLEPAGTLPKLQAHATLSDVIAWNLEAAPFFANLIILAWDGEDYPKGEPVVDALQDAGWELSEIVRVGSAIAREFQYRLGYFTREKVKAQADFTEPPAAGLTP